MGDTLRKHRYQVPIPVRNSDVEALDQCAGKWVLSLIHERDAAPASFFILGLQLHESLEVAINLDCDLDQTITHARAGLALKIEEADASRMIESSRRGLDTIEDDLVEFIRNWFRFVHPDSEDRLDAYNDLAWPPATEVSFQRDDGPPVWGQVDAIFDAKDGGKVLVDWKTSASKQRSSEQLWFYIYGLGLPTTTRAWYHNVARVQKRAAIQEAEPYPGDEHVIDRAERALDKKYRILDTGRVSFQPGPLCNFCVVRDHCPKEGPHPRQALDDLTRAMPLLRPLEEVIEAA